MKRFFIKNMKEEGMAMIIVMGVMLLLLTIAMCIVTLSTNNMYNVGNVTSRFQALNFAQAAVFQGMYELNNTDANAIQTAHPPYAPGNEPTAIPGGTSVTFNNITIDNSNLQSGSCKVGIFSDNLFNPNPTDANFGTYGNHKVPGNTAVIIGEASYKGYKRAIKAIIRNSPSVNSGMTTDKDGTADITNSGSYFCINGISDIESARPVAGAVHANHDVIYGGTQYRCYNGSKFRAVNNINAPNVAAKDKECPVAPIEIKEWSIADLVGSPTWTTPGTMASIYSTGTKPTLEISATPIPDTSGPTNVIIAETGATISGDRYFAGDPSVPNGNVTFIIDTDTEVNGNLVVYGKLRMKGGAKLLVNGTLEVTGNIESKLGTNNVMGGSIITGGYRNGGSNTNVSLDIGGINTDYISSIDDKGVKLFSEGNVKINSTTPSAIDPNADIWIKDQPLNVEATIEALKLVDLDDTPVGSLDIIWPTVKSTLQDDTKVGKEVANWFSDANVDTYMSSSGPIFSSASKWEVFQRNPSLMLNSTQNFFQGIIYAHGDVKAKGDLQVIGAIVTIKSAYTPAGSQGSITIDSGSNIIANQEYMQGSLPLYRILTEVLSWTEL